MSGSDWHAGEELFDCLNPNVNTTMQWKETALRIIGEAAESPPEIQAEIVEWSSLYGTTALMMAVSRENNVDIVKALLSLGAPPDAATEYWGNTALHVAARLCVGPEVVDYIKLLFEAGTDGTLVDRWGLTALDVAEGTRADPDCIAVLQRGTKKRKVDAGGVEVIGGGSSGGVRCGGGGSGGGGGGGGVHRHHSHDHAHHHAHDHSHGQ